MFSAKMIFVVEILPFLTKIWYNGLINIHYNLIKYKEIVNFDRRKFTVKTKGNNKKQIQKIKMGADL